MDLEKDKVQMPETLKGWKPKNLDLATKTCTYLQGYESNEIVSLNTAKIKQRLISRD